MNTLFSIETQEDFYDYEVKNYPFQLKEGDFVHVDVLDPEMHKEDFEIIFGRPKTDKVGFFKVIGLCYGKSKEGGFYQSISLFPYIPDNSDQPVMTLR